MNACLFRPLLIAALLVAGAFGCGERPGSVRELDPEQLGARLEADSTLLLDVRTPEEFAAGHVPGAVNVPVRELEARLAELRPWQGREVIAYCQSGRRAGHALRILERAGFRRLWHLDGDFGDWARAGRPVQRGAGLTGS